MKVIHYIPSIGFSSGGVGTYMQVLAKELGKLVELHVITHDSLSSLPLENCKIHKIPQFKFFKGEAKQAYEKLLHEIDPDIVHVNSCWMPMSAYVQKWSRKKGYPTVYTPHGMLVPWIMKRHYWTKKLPALVLYQKKALQTSDAIHATSYGEAAHIRNLRYNPNVVVIPTGVDAEGIALRKDWAIRKRMLLLSRIHEVKGLNFLIEAVSQLKTEFADWNVEIAGMGDKSYINSLKLLCKEKGCNDIIHFIGSVQGEEKWKKYREADLFLLLSHTENFGIVVAEALASGTPVITTKGTPWEDLETYHCGWWTEIGTEGTVGALKDFLQKDEKELEEMGRNGRKLIEEKYSDKRISKDMVKLYESLINKNKKSR